MSKRSRYGLSWSEEYDDAQIECECVRRGGQWEKDGKTYGAGLYEHFYNLFRLYWPHEDEHKWEREILKAILSNQFSVLMGSSGSTKTSTAAKFALASRS